MTRFQPSAAGKGDGLRPVDKDKYDANYSQIDWSDGPPPVKKELEEMTVENMILGPVNQGILRVYRDQTERFPKDALEMSDG